MSIVERVNKISVSGDLLSEANAAHAALAPNDRRSIEAVTMALIRMLHAKGLEGARRRDTLLAVQLRMEAMAQLSAETHPEMQTWTLQSGEKGMDYVQGIMFEAAAQEPLIEIADRVSFNPQTFFARLLGLSQERGRA